MTNEQKLDEFIKQIGGNEDQKAAYSCLMAAFVEWLDSMEDPTEDQQANKNELSALAAHFFEVEPDSRMAFLLVTFAEGYIRGMEAMHIISGGATSEADKE